MKTISKYGIILAIICTLTMLAGCGGSSSNIVDGKLVAKADGYIHLTASEFWEYMNADIFAQNKLKLSNREFGEEYNGKRFVISGTLKSSPGFHGLTLYNGNNSIEGGSQFDYRSTLKELGIGEDMDYDGKDVIIMFTLNEGEMVSDTLRANPYLSDLSFEVKG